MFTCEFDKFLKTPFFLEHLWWLVLYANLNWKYENNSKEKKWAAGGNMNFKWIKKQEVKSRCWAN